MIVIIFSVEMYILMHKGSFPLIISHITIAIPVKVILQCDFGPYYAALLQIVFHLI